MANPLSSSFTGIKDDTEINLDNADKLVWTTEKVDKLVLAMKEGYVTRDNPFYEGDQNFRRGQLVFNYSQFELDELRHCARDIVYFANTYCKVMTDDGYQQITLRDYQEEILRTFQHNRWDILMAPRQCGKCTFYNSKIKIKYPNGEIKDTTIGDFYYSAISPSILGKIKVKLYKILEILEK
jgi:predicted Zn-ribbon and HTH transcriptional regulator